MKRCWKERLLFGNDAMDQRKCPRLKDFAGGGRHFDRLMTALFLLERGRAPPWQGRVPATLLPPRSAFFACKQQHGAGKDCSHVDTNLSKTRSMMSMDDIHDPPVSSTCIFVPPPRVLHGALFVSSSVCVRIKTVKCS